MTQPVVPMELLPWIEFGGNSVHLKPDAPDELKPVFDSFKGKMEKADDEQTLKL